MKKFLIALGLVCLLPLSALADSTSTPPVSVVTALGASFVSSPEARFESTGFSKALIFIYRVNPNFSVGANYSGIDFQATTLTQADIEQYGLLAIYHGSLGGKFGGFVKGQFMLSELGGGPLNFSQALGGGLFYNINETYSVIAGLDPTLIDHETKTYGATAYVGLERSLR